MFGQRVYDSYVGSDDVRIRAVDVAREVVVATIVFDGATAAAKAVQTGRTFAMQSGPKRIRPIKCFNTSHLYLQALPRG